MIRGLSLCEAFSLPPRAIIKTEANRQSAGADAVFCAPSSLTKASFRRSAVSQKIVQPLVARFASFRDSVGIRQNHVLSGGIGYFTGRNNVI